MNVRALLDPRKVPAALPLAAKAPVSADFAALTRSVLPRRTATAIGSADRPRRTSGANRHGAATATANATLNAAARETEKWSVGTDRSRSPCSHALSHRHSRVPASRTQISSLPTTSTSTAETVTASVSAPENPAARSQRCASVASMRSVSSADSSEKCFRQRAVGYPARRTGCGRSRPGRRATHRSGRRRRSSPSRARARRSTAAPARTYPSRSRRI